MNVSKGWLSGPSPRGSPPKKGINKEYKVFFPIFSIKFRVLKLRFLAFPEGPRGFRELREAGRKHFHRSWYLLVPGVTSSEFDYFSYFFLGYIFLTKTWPGLNLYVLGPKTLDSSSKTIHIVLFPGLNSSIQINILQNLYLSVKCRVLQNRCFCVFPGVLEGLGRSGGLVGTNFTYPGT